MTANCYILTGRGCPDQTGQNDFGVQEGRMPGFFRLVYRSEAIFLLFRSVLHTYAYYLMAQKGNSGKLLPLEEVAIPARSVSVGHGYLQHAGCVWYGSHNLRYYIISSLRAAM